MFRIVLLVVPLLLFLACTGEGDGPAAVIPLCTPVENADRGPCEEAESIVDTAIRAGQPVPLPDVPRQIGLIDGGGFPTSHIALRGTFLPDTSRCTPNNPFRAPDFMLDDWGGPDGPGGGKSLHYHCYIDIRANEYYQGDGPSRFTIMIFGWGHGSIPVEAEEDFSQVLADINANVMEGGEYIVFVGPSMSLSVEAWQLLGILKVVRGDDGTVTAHSPLRNRWLAEKPDVAAAHIHLLETPLADVVSRITTVFQEREQKYGGRIGAEEGLTMLRGNINELHQYFEDVGAYDEGEPTPLQPPPSCAVGVPAEERAGLLQDCNILLGLKDTLRGTAELNWTAVLPIAEWDGVKAENGRVTQVILLDKGLNGTVPPELGDLTELQALWLGTNQLTGTIPGEIANAQGMESLLLNGNQLTGTIPPEFRAFTSMETLWLHQNQLSGSIPPELGAMTSLQHLVLSSNSLTGTIPREISTRRTLRILWLSHNDLSGRIPGLFVALDNLERLHLQGNQLTGAIPRTLTRIADNLEELFLGDNLLTGCIPPELKEVDRNDLDELSLPDCE